METRSITKTKANECVPLLQIPNELLEWVWNHLENTGNQHSLRLTCKVARHLTAPWIRSLRHELVSKDRGSLQRVLDRRFPQDATLLNLYLNYVGLGRRARLHHVILLTTAMEGLKTLVFTGNVVSRKPHATCMQNTGDSRHATAFLTLQVLSVGDMHCIVGVCPLLKVLELGQVKAAGRIFEPLAALGELEELRVKGMRARADDDTVPQSLAGLTQLLKLSIFGPAEEEDDVYQMLTIDRVLGSLAGLQSLRSLSINLLAHRDTPEGLRILRHMQHLTRLDYSGFRSLQVAEIAEVTQLISLTLGDSDLPSDAVPILAALPNLTELHAMHLDADADFSGLQCNWRRLCLDPNLTTSRELLMLPLSGVREIVCDSFDFVLGSITAAEIKRAAHLLAPRWVATSPELFLGWQEAGREAPPPSTSWRPWSPCRRTSSR